MKGKKFLKVLFTLSFLILILESTENQVFAIDENPAQGKARIIVKKDLSQINVRDIKIDTHSKWEAKDCFIDAFDRDGYPLDFEEITVSSDVDVNKAGTYQVHFEYKNRIAIATVKVEDSPMQKLESKILSEKSRYQYAPIVLNEDLFKKPEPEFEPEKLASGGARHLNRMVLGYYLSGTLLFGQRRIEKC
ncbi:bacterial Ig-like domain-containing protein [Enterococcus sp. DIV0187]|uniref:bacterial Ig-like domain-containing protein n=1 Tax=Enterococcus sp. DIV0187 TaxID=2774644 RepID=UPI003F23D928